MKHTLLILTVAVGIAHAQQPTTPPVSRGAQIAALVKAGDNSAALALADDPSLKSLFYRITGDLAQAESLARAAVAADPANAGGQSALLFALRDTDAPRATRHAASVAAVNSVAKWSGHIGASLAWNTIDRSSLSPQEVVALADKLLLTVDVTPESAKFLSRVKSTRDALAQ